MRRLILIFTVLAMTVSFLPTADAGDENTATTDIFRGNTLTLEVSFSTEPVKIITIITDPAGPFEIRENDTLKFSVIAEDVDSHISDLRAESLPVGASFTLMETIMIYPRHKLQGTFIWTPGIGTGRPDPYPVTFVTKSEDSEANIIVRISVLPAKPKPIISIELDTKQWTLKGVKLGEEKPTTIGVKNTGNVAVSVDIGYSMYDGCTPGLKAGRNQFATLIGPEVIVRPLVSPEVGMPSRGRPIPPSGRASLLEMLAIGEKQTVSLVYCAPTEIDNGTTTMRAQFELRAYPALDAEKHPM